jgi:hypothetical protein
MAGWAGVFGLSRDTAHGLLLHDPPVEVEHFYSDYTMGNANLHVFRNGTVRVEMVLRNAMESPSPLEERIFRSFDTRPDWDRYVARSRNMLAGMFGLDRGTGENLTFTTGYAELHAANVTDGLGRSCVTHLQFSDVGTRQYFIEPGEQDPVPDMTLSFADPWKFQGGFMDRVTVSWDDNLTCIGAEALNMTGGAVMQDMGGLNDGMLGWSNSSQETAPVLYRLEFKFDD